MMYRDCLGQERRESAAKGRILYQINDHIRVRRAGFYTPESLDLILEWWDGERWLHMQDTNEISNDYAYSWINERGRSLIPYDEAYRINHEIAGAPEETDPMVRYIGP